MSVKFAEVSGCNVDISVNDNILKGIFKQYESVIIESLLTSFAIYRL